jgi:hypothetical protein
MRIFLGPHRPCLILVRVPQPCFLNNLAAAFDDVDLAVCFMLDNRLHEADAVHILGLGPRAKLVAGLAYRHIDIGAH